jgi:hypothetical protein
MSCWILVLPILQEFEEFLGSPLLKETHQWTPHRFHLSAWDLRDGSISKHVATGDLFELEIASHVGVYENLSEFTGGDDELGNKIDGIVTIASKVRWGSPVGAELAIELLCSRAPFRLRCDHTLSLQHA